MIFGETYVEVDANVVGGGIMPMAIISSASGPEEGATDLVVWIKWYYDTETGDGGFTGNGWFWNDENNILPDKFASEQAFKDYLIEYQPENLDEYLATGTAWPTDKKRAFFNKYLATMGGCFQV